MPEPQAATPARDAAPRPQRPSRPSLDTPLEVQLARAAQARRQLRLLSTEHDGLRR